METTERMARKVKDNAKFAFTTWIGAFVAGVLFTILVGELLSVFWSIGKLEATIQYQQKTLDQQQKTLEEIKRDVTEIRNKQK